MRSRRKQCSCKRRRHKKSCLYRRRRVKTRRMRGGNTITTSLSDSFNNARASLGGFRQPVSSSAYVQPSLANTAQYF